MKIRLIIFVLILIPFIANAQIGDTVFKIGKGKVYKFDGVKRFPMIFYDYDNPENDWLSIVDYAANNSIGIYRVDENLNLIDSLNMQAKYCVLKYNNKVYGLRLNNYRYTNNDIFMDTITFLCYDINGNQLKKNFVSTYDSDTIKYQCIYTNALFSKEKQFVIFEKNYSYLPTVYSKILIVDTLGNVVRTKIHKFDDYTNINIIETDNNFELISNDFSISDKTILRVLDKNTLEIIDTTQYYYPKLATTNPYNINDSILITFGNYIIGDTVIQTQIKIANRQTLNSKNIAIQKGISNSIDDGNQIPFFSKKMDYINMDSIYFVCYSYRDTIVMIDENIGYNNPALSNYQIIRIFNFNINGTLNFDYALEVDTTLWKQVNGIRATYDGGLIIAVTSVKEGYFIKFMPNGFVGLSNVETGERASLRVYPNPAKDFVLVDIEADRFEKADIEIYDLGGRMVKKSKLSAKVGNRIDVSDLRAGVYSYRVALNGKGVSGKIVIGE